MDRDFDDDDSFEYFLQKKVDQYKMYPSEGVWKRIYNTIHTRRRWFRAGGSLLILGGMIFISQELLFPGASSLAVKPRVQTVQPSVSSALLSPKPDLSISTKAYPLNKIISKNTGPGSLQAEHLAGAPTRAGVVKSGFQKGKFSRKQTIADAGVLPVQPVTLDESGKTSAEVNQVGSQISSIDISAGNNSIATPKTASANKNAATSEPSDKIDASKKRNWLQEMAVIKLSLPQKSRFNLQFYFSPTVSYRKLADNGSELNANQRSVPFAIDHPSIDRFVDHIPSVGVEFGSNVLFAAFENLTLKTGLQLNYSRYNIKAYSSYYEKASFALNRVGTTADTITTYTSLRNFNGYSPEQLQNQYLQVSMPVGAELKLLGNKRLQLNIAGTIQPTYLLFNDTYLLSMDYVNYAKEESLVRKWNVNTSAEAFISYKTGGVRWQLGPQFRYQLMSSYNDRYPIRENLLEYGIKAGVSKTIR